MKSRLFAISAMLLGMAFSAPAYAQQPLPNALGGEGAFHDFLQGHPQIRHDLEQNPSLVNDPAYIVSHPQFNQFYQNHSEVRDELKQNAPDFMRKEESDFAHPQQYQRSEQNWKAGVNEQRQEGNLDTFLDAHPEIQQKLEKNPDLANNPEFLRNHPGFAHFAETHPGVQQQLRDHPHKFMDKEKNYQEH